MGWGGDERWPAVAQNVPPGRIESLQWLEGIIGTWNANFAGIGLTSAQVVDLAQDIVNTRSSFTSVEQIRAESKSKTQDFYSQSDNLSAKAGAFVTIIKGFADASGDPAAVYTLADLTPKDPPSPMPAPDQPAIVQTALNGDGSVTVNYIGNGPTGTTWQVSRKLAGETGFTFVGNADSLTKSYRDTTIPAGADSATYIVTGTRGSLTGLPSIPAVVQFGSADAEGMAMAA